MTTPGDFRTRSRCGLAKRVIQVHSVSERARVMIASRAPRRDQFLACCAQPPQGYVVAMEARSSAHHWG